MEPINLRHPTVGFALTKLKADLIIEHGSIPAAPKIIGPLFEKKYNCTIVAEDAYCTEGHLTFPDDQYRTLFLLQFSNGNNGKTKY